MAVAIAGPLPYHARQMGVLDLFRRKSSERPVEGGRGHITELPGGSGLGTVTLEDGRKVRFRAADCQGFAPAPFVEVYVDEVLGDRAVALARPPEQMRQATTQPRRAQMAPEEPARPELEHALLANPDDEASHLVLGDWLQGQGHPRGELIALMHRLEHTPSPAALDELRALLGAHRRALLGEILDGVSDEALAGALRLESGRVRLDLPDGSLRTGWRLGFLRQARVAEAPRSGPGLDRLEALLAHPSARLLEELTLGLIGLDDPEYDGALEILAAAGHRPALRRLFIGDFVYPDEMEMSWTSIGDLGPLYPLYPKLRELTLQAGDFTLGEIALPELRSFELRTGGLRRPCIESICQASWPGLERLVLWFGDAGYGAEATMDDIEPILAARGLPRLRELGLMNCELTDEICERLPAASVAGMIERLDLSLGTMSDNGARALAAGREAFGRLERLDVSMNYLTDEGVQALRGLCSSVIVGEQQAGDEGERYVTVGE